MLDALLAETIFCYILEKINDEESNLQEQRIRLSYYQELSGL
jgi:hypothetical protein